MSHLRWRLAIAVAALLSLAGAGNALAAPGELFFSEYIEGSSNNKALEIYNGTGAPVDLGANAYNVQMFFNGSSTAGLTINLTGTVANGDVFVLAQSSAVAAILDEADQTNGAGWFNGDDAVVLRRSTTVLDVIGQIGFDPGTEWGTGLTSTADNTLRRLGAIEAGDTNGSDVFEPSVEWEGFATDTFGGLGSHVAGDAAPSVTSTNPAGGATGVAPGADISVTFSEPVVAGSGAFTVSCTTSGAHAVSVSGGPSAYTVDPAADFALGESCTVTVHAAQVTDVDADDPPDAMTADYVFSFTVAVADPCTQPYTPIPAIQGSGLSAAITGTVTTRGVVVGDHEGAAPALRGFYLQDPSGDGDAATSDAIFVFNGGNQDLVSVGDVVQVTGNAGENQEQTQVSTSAVNIHVCDAGTVTPTDVTLPVASATFLERYEGMLVRMAQPLYVTEHFQLGRFGQVVLSSGDRLTQPTSVVAPGAPAVAMQAQNNLNRLILDDSSQFQNPDPIVWARNGMPLSATNTLRGGDTVTGAVGVMTYTWAGNAASGNAYRLRPLNALGGTATFVAANPRPTATPNVGGRVQVAGMNVLNFFNTFTGCTAGVAGGPTDCRGANNVTEFDRQWPKTVAAILATGADVVGLGEIENDGYGPTSAIQFLVDRLNAATAPGTWALIDADARSGQVDALGTDAIKVGLIYKPGVVTPVGTTGVLNSVAFVNGGDSAPRNRATLAQAFVDNESGVIFVVTPNHLKSKGSACDAPDAGDGQGNCAIVRTNSANLLADWLLNQNPTGTGSRNVLIVGDLNSYAKEHPIAALEAAGFTNLISTFLGPDAYSYVFDGQWGYLDHALGSPAILPSVTGVAEFHINADEPSVLDYNTDFKTANLIASLYAPDMYRMSDHDPVIAGLGLETTFASLCELTRVYASDPAVAEELCEKLHAAAAAAARGDGRAKAGQLGAFVRQVRAQSGKALTQEEADMLIRLAGTL